MNPRSSFTEMMAVNAAGGVKVSEMPLSMWFPDTDYGGGGVTVWAGMSTQRKTDLDIINGTVTGRSYLRDIINPIIIPQHRQYAPNDNAPPHRANIVRALIQEVGLRHMEWPALSPTSIHWSTAGINLRGVSRPVTDNHVTYRNYVSQS